MTENNVVRDGLTARDVLVIMSLDVKGAFNAAWWPAFSNGLRT